MDAKMIVRMALDAALEMKRRTAEAKGKGAAEGEEKPDGVFRREDGAVVVRRTFTLNAAAAADKAGMETHPEGNRAEQGAAGTAGAQDEAAPEVVAVCDGIQVNGKYVTGSGTPVVNCKAKNPMFCPYHGIPAMTEKLNGMLKAKGLSEFTTLIKKRISGAFQIEVFSKDADDDDNKVKEVGETIKATIGEFLAQPGFHHVEGSDWAGSEKELNGDSVQNQAAAGSLFKQDVIQKPSDLEMMGEWMDKMYVSALEEDSLVDLNELTDLESKLAELHEKSGDQPEGYDQLLEDAKNQYHKMRSKVEFGGAVTSIEQAKNWFSAYMESFEKFEKSAASLDAQKKAAMAANGWKTSPPGFPGNPEYNNAMSSVSHFDKNLMSAAEEQMHEAKTLDEAILALYNGQFALGQMNKHSLVHSQHAMAMIGNYKKAMDVGKPIGGSAAEKTAWWEKHGIAYPEELKAIKESAAGKEAKQETEPKAEKPSKAVSEAKTKKKPLGTPDGDLSIKKLPALDHDESKFPQNVTKAMLDEALANAVGHFTNAGGGAGVFHVKIGGKDYVCKVGTGTVGDSIENGYLCDMAYRAGGIHAPDSNLYKFNGKTYKLSEFIKGERLDSVMGGTDEAKKETVRRELLKGYALDALFSNWDVLGTNPSSGKHFTNVILGEDGNVYRIDNDGAFDATGKAGGTKTLDAAKSNLQGKCAFEDWEEKGGWHKREWPDDWRTMRLDPMNEGVFDKYTTHQIFDAAANIDFASAVSALPQNIKDALAKPLHEMREMAFHASGAKIAGYKMGTKYSWTETKAVNGVMKQVKHTVDLDPVSVALDSVYDSNKAGCREFLQKKTSWANLGWLDGTGATTKYTMVPFSKPAPVEPKPPSPGVDYAKEVLEGVKTINYHVEQGDYTPNESRVKKALAVKPMLEQLSSAGNEKAKGLLDAIAKIENSIATGNKEMLTFDTPDGFLDVNGLSIVSNQDEIDAHVAKMKPLHDQWKKDYAQWTKEKADWDEAEMKKAKAAGAAPAKSFKVYEDNFISSNLNTHGIAQGGGNPDVINNSKHGQKSMSWTTEACKKKVRQYAMMGIPLEKMKFSHDDPVFYNGHSKNGGHHVSGGGNEDKKYFNAVDYYTSHPDEFKKDMEAYSRHKGMMVLVHSNILHDAIDKSTGSVFVIRGEHSQAWGKDGANAPSGTKVIKPYPIDCSSSATIEHNGHFGGHRVGWKLPIWRVTDTFMVDGGSEHEICINPINIPHPPMHFSSSDAAKGWAHCMKLYNQSPEVVAANKKVKSALP